MARDLGRYDPAQAPDRERWLALDESERLEFVLSYHRRARVKLPNARVHAVIHNVVETQVAMGDEIPVAGTLRRLQKEGLDRHDAIHAVGSVLAKHMFELMKESGAAGDPNAAYWADLSELKAKEWRRAR